MRCTLPVFLTQFIVCRICCPLYQYHSSQPFFKWLLLCLKALPFAIHLTALVLTELANICNTHKKQRKRSSSGEESFNKAIKNWFTLWPSWPSGSASGSSWVCIIGFQFTPRLFSEMSMQLSVFTAKLQKASVPESDHMKPKFNSRTIRYCDN